MLHRANVGLDFCAYAEVLAMLGGADAAAALYRYFLFVNDTVRGPFLPPYLPRGPPSLRWYASRPCLGGLTVQFPVAPFWLLAGYFLCLFVCCLFVVVAVLLLHSFTLQQ